MSALNTSEPLHIVYPKKKNHDCQYDAIGINPIKLNSKSDRLNEKCVFSQFKLSECESISAIIYSIANKGNNIGNKWYFLCDGTEMNDNLNRNKICNNSNYTKIHLFDSDYL
eukprot:331705_1